MAEPLKVIIEDDDETVRVDPDTGTVVEDQDDGGVLVHFDAKRFMQDDDKEDEWFANLAEDMDAVQLGIIANDLISAIEADDKSRQEYLATRARGFDILGIKLEKPVSSVEDGVEGMSRVTNPLLLEAILKGWANAQAELLPATGPCKIKNDGNSETVSTDDLAEAYERGMNHYLTVTAPEYYPDTSHMLLWGTYYGGSGFKKIFRCPMRRRPVSESVDAKDLIVSDASKDFASCARITHQIPMRPSVMKRMVLLGVYKQTAMTQPSPTPNVVDEKIAGIQGTEARPHRPEDQPYTIWESQCELDIPRYAPGKFDGEGIPLPYLVTIDKDSREILSITRDWDEDDEECTRLQMYVRYPYVPGPGFYGTGMLNILGNASAAMTAAWREALDAGMFANFPGGLIAKLGGRQNSATIRLSPGQFEPIETNGMPINNIVMGAPYKDITPGLLGIIDKVTEQAKSLGTSAEVPAGEGLANIPVGTMLAQIEQATKIMAAAHKGMHQAQGEEIRLLTRLFRRNPEDFWINNKECPPDYWDELKLIQAIDTCSLVPVSDPNIPSHVHRVAKAVGLVQLSAMPQFQSRLDPDELLRRVLNAIREDPVGLMVQPPPSAGMAPQDQAKLITAEAKVKEVDAKIGKLQTDQSTEQGKAAMKMWELQAEKDIKDTDITKELIIHQADQAKIAASEHKDEVALAAKARLEGEANQLQRERHGLELVKAGVDARQADRTHETDMMKHTQEHGLDRLTSEREHHLGVAKHVLETAKAASDHALSVHEALHPPPAKKRADGGAVVADEDETFTGRAMRIIRRLRKDGGRVVVVDQEQTEPDYEKIALRDMVGQLTGMVENISRDAYTAAEQTAQRPKVDHEKQTLRDMVGQLTGVVEKIGKDAYATAEKASERPEYGQLATAMEKLATNLSDQRQALEQMGTRHPDYDQLAKAMQALGNNLVNQQAAFDKAIKAMTAPRRLTRDDKGDLTGVETVLPIDAQPSPVKVIIERD